MSSRKRLAIGSFSSVAPSSNANLRIPEGPIYDKIAINAFSGTTPLSEANAKTHLERIELKSNQNIIVDASSTDIINLNKYYGNAFIDGVVELMFARPWMRTIFDEDILGFGTAGLSNINLNVKLSSTVTSPKLEGFSKESGYGQRAYPVVETTAKDYTVAASGVFEITDIEKNKYHLAAVHFSGVTITKVEVIYLNNKIIDITSDIAKADDQDNGKTWQSGYFHLNFMNSDRLSEALAMNVGQFSIKVTTSNTGTMRVVTEKIRGLDTVMKVQ